MNHCEYNSQVIDFLEIIKKEQKFFDLKINRFQESEMCVIAMVDSEIIGMTGLLKKKGIVRNYIAVSRSYYRKGIGKKLNHELLTNAAKKYNFLMSLIDTRNIKSLKLYLSCGYKLLGERFGMNYTILHFNKKGFLVYCLLKLFFPILNIIDTFRKIQIINHRDEKNT